jgi:hypothetical protein
MLGVGVEAEYERVTRGSLDRLERDARRPIAGGKEGVHTVEI